MFKLIGKNYIPGSQSFAAGFLGPRGDAGFFMHFDYKKAKEKFKNTDKIETITAGLDGDFTENSDIIFEDGKWNDSYHFHDHSIWAEPIIIVEYKNKPMEAYKCWKKGKKS